MKESKSIDCSRIQTERYLLNRLSAEEETRFQEHLETCQDCRRYVDSVRTLSALMGGDELHYATHQRAEPRKTARLLSLWPYISVAASVLLLVGISFYWVYRTDEYGTTSHETSINELSKGDLEEAPFQLLFPDKDTLSISTVKAPLIFKWNKAVDYRLILRAGNQTLVEVESSGDSYTLEVEKLGNWPAIDWVLYVENKEWNGRIYLTK
ncbi:MAG: zf-HC2 domain-containing protein [Tannerellaceae bacterium]|jgi:hypothetical protein|nr:zf-HC2 domain-containing protein [Tannerellaceae bacterium]